MKKELEELLGSELAQGIIEVSKISPVVEKALKYKTTEELLKNLAATVIVIVDNHLNDMKNVTQFLKANPQLIKEVESGNDILANLNS